MKYIFFLVAGLLFTWALFGSDGRYSIRYSVSQNDTIQEINVSPAADAAAAERELEKQKVQADSILQIIDSAVLAPHLADTTKKPADTAAYKADTALFKPFLDDIISGTSQDSLVFEPGSKMVYIFEKGDVKYQSKNLKADYMQVNIDTKNIFAKGRMDSVKETGEMTYTRTEFNDGGTALKMDSINYNLKTGKALTHGFTTQEGEGYLRGQTVKKMHDNTFNIANGIYTTCDQDPNPHFYLKMTKAKAIPGKKVIVGPSYLVFEDVPIYFLGVPFGFFPQTSERSSGFIVPEYGEEYVKGFFIRNGGYYFAFNDYIDATVTGGVYTLGSWETALSSRYLKKYKFAGNLALRYSKDIIGEKGAADYQNMSNFSVQWTHTQDAKFRPNSTFSASVNFSTSGYNKYSATNMNDYLNTQTSSSIAYSKRWAGKPISFQANLQHSQNSRDTTVSLGFPNAVISVSKIYPFRRAEQIGKQRWYEKIGMTYTGNLANRVENVKEYDLFTEKMFKGMKNGVNHQIPVSASFNLLKYINLSPSLNYQERWYFKRVDKEWDDMTNQVAVDTTYGFYRVYNYNASMSTSTKIYGEFTFGKNFPLQALRHVMTPTASISFAPDFGDPKYGYYKPVQTDTTGTISYYSPYEGSLYGVPGRGKSASLSFSLVNTLEAKVKSKTDTTGVKKLKIIDNFSISSSYNFLADSLNLNPFSLNLRTANLFGNFGINISATLDPYVVVNNNGQPVRINRLMWRDGKIGRITNTGWSTSYTFKSSKSSSGAVNDISNGGNSAFAEQASNFFSDPTIDPAIRRQQMLSQYYDFDIPWNVGVSYSLGYTDNGIKKNVTQSMNFNGSVVLTKKWGITFTGGYDLQKRELSPMTFVLTRELHCWQMNFTWVPIGFRQSWSFNIGVRSAMLKDLKYDKRSSFYDNLYD